MLGSMSLPKDLHYWLMLITRFSIQVREGSFALTLAYLITEWYASLRRFLPAPLQRCEWKLHAKCSRRNCPVSLFILKALSVNENVKYFFTPESQQLCTIHRALYFWCACTQSIERIKAPLLPPSLYSALLYSLIGENGNIAPLTPSHQRWWTRIN